MVKMQPLTYYEVLGLDKGTPTTVLQKRYDKLKQLYSSSHYFMRGLLTTKQLYIYTHLLDDILKVLKNPELRKEYDIELSERLLSLQASLPDDFSLAEIVRRYEKQIKTTVKQAIPQDVFGRTAVVENIHLTLDKKKLDKATAIMKDIPIGGEEIQKLREASGMSVKILSDKTRISRFILVCIENEDFAALPATTYVRGFLNTIGKTLKLDDVFRNKILTDYISKINHAKQLKKNITEASSHD